MSIKLLLNALLNRACLVLLIAIFQATVLIGQQLEPVGIFDHHQDVGDPKLKGSVVYDKENQTYTLSGAGKNMWTTADQFHFAWKKIKGDFIIRASIKFIGKGAAEHRKIGIIARDKLTTESRYVDACVHGDVLTCLQYRPKDGDSTYQVVLSTYHPTEIELERSGNTFTFSAAVFGEPYKSVTKELPLNEEVYAGLFMCSHVVDVIEKAVFSNVQIIIPPAKNYVPYKDYIGSHLEIMDVATGHRKILHSAPNSLQAPNWTPDNKFLIFNSLSPTENLLFKYDLKDGSISKLNTGFATHNNNDHVLSFDGKMLAISNHVGEKRTSTIYTLPVTGSDTPTKITSEENGHSYLHSWSPDGKKLLFTGQRNKEWNIMSIDIATKKETALTEDATLDDGPEYSPDGKYIYFNSVRSGTMQIWRMKPDGKDQEQVTNDEFNNWFAHLSPDGKSMVFLSFLKEEVEPGIHPPYKNVYIRFMPVAGGTPKVLAYVYGGQGSINTPSWSPDSKRIAFISNTNMSGTNASK